MLPPTEIPPLDERLAEALVSGLGRHCNGATAIVTPNPELWGPLFQGRLRNREVHATCSLSSLADTFETVLLLEILDGTRASEQLQAAWQRVEEGGVLIVADANSQAAKEMATGDAPSSKALKKLLRGYGKVRPLREQPFRWLAMKVAKRDESARKLSRDQLRRYEVTAGLCRGHVLELGCGRGHLSHFASKRGCRTLGIDKSSQKIALALQRYPDHDFRAADILEVDLPEAGFDTVLLPELLEHVDEPLGRKMLDRAWEWLAPGGRLVVSVPNEDCIPHPNHLREFNVASLAKELAPYGEAQLVTDQPYKWLLMFVDKPMS